MSSGMRAFPFAQGRVGEHSVPPEVSGVLTFRKDPPMKALTLGALAAALLFSAPAFAQDVRIRAGEGGVSIRSDDGGPGYRRHRGPDRVIIRERRAPRVVVRERCRNVVIRTERPNGTVVVRRERRCS